MRIISGRWKGHPLVSFKADHIRPTTDRVKESLFNILQGELEGAFVADLFCGTGSLGLEALSRGAQHVSFVDKNSKSIRITTENIQQLKVDKSEYSIRTMDVLKYLIAYQGDPFDLIFIDPPFTEKMAHEVMTCLDQSQCVSDKTWIMIESAKRERIDEEYATVIRVDVREFGDKVLSFFRKKSHKENS